MQLIGKLAPHAVKFASQSLRRGGTFYSSVSADTLPEAAASAPRVAFFRSAQRTVGVSWSCGTCILGRLEGVHSMVGGGQCSRVSVPLGRSEFVSIFSLRAELCSHGA